MVNLLGLAMKLTGLKPMDSVSKVQSLASFGNNPSAQAPGGKMVSHSREEVEAFLAIFDGVADEMAEGWKEGETNLAVKRRMIDHLNSIIQRF